MRQPFCYCETNTVSLTLRDKLTVLVIVLRDRLSGLKGSMAAVYWKTSAVAFEIVYQTTSLGTMKYNGTPVSYLTPASFIAPSPCEGHPI